jgi:hypothetical protein
MILCRWDQIRKNLLLPAIDLIFVNEDSDKLSCVFSRRSINAREMRVLKRRRGR